MLGLFEVVCFCDISASAWNSLKLCLLLFCRRFGFASIPTEVISVLNLIDRLWERNFKVSRRNHEKGKAHLLLAYPLADASFSQGRSCAKDTLRSATETALWPSQSTWKFLAFSGGGREGRREGRAENKQIAELRLEKLISTSRFNPFHHLVWIYRQRLFGARLPLSNSRIHYEGGNFTILTFQIVYHLPPLDPISLRMQNNIFQSD